MVGVTVAMRGGMSGARLVGRTAAVGVVRPRSELSAYLLCSIFNFPFPGILSFVNKSVRCGTCKTDQPGR